MKKVKYNDANISKILINKMMEKYNLTTDDLEKLDDHKIDGVKWFQYYTWTQEEADEYRRWFCQYFTKNVSPRMPMPRILKMYEWFNLGQGLKIVEDGKS